MKQLKRTKELASMVLVLSIVFASLATYSAAHASPIETTQFSTMDIPQMKAEKIGCFVTLTPQMSERGERFFKEGC